MYFRLMSTSLLSFLLTFFVDFLAKFVDKFSFTSFLSFYVDFFADFFVNFCVEFYAEFFAEFFVNLSRTIFLGQHFSSQVQVTLKMAENSGQGELQLLKFLAFFPLSSRPFRFQSFAFSMMLRR